jgi:glutathione S-transferase
MKLYGHPMSTCTRKVLTVLAEKGHEAQFVLVDLMKGSQKQADYLARHPFGVVPFLEDDGFSLYESRAICRYIDQKLPGHSLTPGDLKARGLMEQWISVEQSYFGDHVVKILRQRVFAPMSGKESDENVVDGAKHDVAKALDVADKALAKSEYFAGSTFTLADICWMPYMHYLFTCRVGELVTDRPNVNAWWKRVSTRPSWVKVSA